MLARNGAEVGQFWLFHRKYKHAHGRGAEAFPINREVIALAFSMKDHGVPLDTLRAVARERLAQAKADYQTKRDPFDWLAAA